MSFLPGRIPTHPRSAGCYHPRDQHACSGPGSLRQEVLDAVQNDTIMFGMTSTITLTCGHLTTTGPCENLLNISGGRKYCVFEIPFGLYSVNISDLPIANGNLSEDGSLYNESTGSFYYIKYSISQKFFV